MSLRQQRQTGDKMGEGSLWWLCRCFLTFMSLEIPELRSFAKSNSSVLCGIVNLLLAGLKKILRMWKKHRGWRTHSQILGTGVVFWHRLGKKLWIGAFSSNNWNKWMILGYSGIGKYSTQDWKWGVFCDTCCVQEIEGCDFFIGGEGVGSWWKLATCMLFVCVRSDL